MNLYLVFYHDRIEYLEARNDHIAKQLVLKKGGSLDSAHVNHIKSMYKIGEKLTFYVYDQQPME